MSGRISACYSLPVPSTFESDPSPLPSDSGITSLVFTEHGEALYLVSSSLYQRLALSSGVAVRPSCRLTLPEGARPAAGAAKTAGAGAEPTAAAAGGCRVPGWP